MCMQSPLKARLQLFCLHRQLLTKLYSTWLSCWTYYLWNCCAYYLIVFAVGIDNFTLLCTFIYSSTFMVIVQAWCRTYDRMICTSNKFVALYCWFQYFSTPLHSLLCTNGFNLNYSLFLELGDPVVAVMMLYVLFSVIDNLLWILLDIFCSLMSVWQMKNIYYMHMGVWIIKTHNDVTKLS